MLFEVSFDNNEKHFPGFKASNGKVYFHTYYVAKLLTNSTTVHYVEALALFLGNCQVKDVTDQPGLYMQPDQWVVEWNALRHYLYTMAKQPGSNHPKHVALLNFLVDGKVRVESCKWPGNCYDVIEDASSNLTFSEWVHQCIQA